MIFFKDIDQSQKKSIGGKAWNLSELVHLGMPVPKGFVIPTSFFSQYILDKESFHFESAFLQELEIALKELPSETFAVRSSASVEDSAEYSFAGQFTTQLGVQSSDIMAAIKKGWESVFTAQSKEYSSQHGVALEQVKMAIIIQQQLRSDVSGIAFTAHPLTNDQNQIVVEGGYGLGELFVSGQATPTTWTIDKTTSQTIQKFPGYQDRQLIIEHGKVVEQPLSSEASEKECVSEGQLGQLVSLLKQIEKHFGRPQDVEWAIEQESLYILQARPITTL